MPRASSQKALAAAASPGVLTFELDGWTLERFFIDNDRVSIIQGPIGSGKTRASIMRMYRHCSEQPPQRDGMRRSRWMVVRQTYPELKSTTIKAFLEVFPEGDEANGGFGHMTWSPPYTYHFKSGDIEAEFIFLALEKEDDVRKLRSLEATGVYFNELQYIPMPMFVEALSRCGRYPSVVHGGCTWYGVIADMNAPEALHWVPIMFGMVPMPDHFSDDDVRAHTRPPAWNLFIQPPALIEETNDRGETTGYVVNPQAENLMWLTPEYYAEKMHGQTKGWIDANCLNKAAAIVKGRAVHPKFSADRHVARSALRYTPDLDLYGGFDFGLQPAAIFGQTVRGRVFVLFELYAEDVGAVTFAPFVKAELIRRVPNINLDRLKLFGDPGGDIRGQSDEKTAFEIFRKHGLHIRRAPGANRFGPNQGMGRKEVVDNLLERQVDGYQALLLDPSCRMLSSGLQGGYQFKVTQTSVGAYSSGDIVKNKYSHPCEAFQYMLLGMGEGSNLIMGASSKRSAPVDTRTKARVFDRGARAPIRGRH